MLHSLKNNYKGQWKTSMCVSLASPGIGIQIRRQQAGVHHKLVRSVRHIHPHPIKLPVQEALSFAEAPVELLVGGGAFLAAAVGYLGWEALKQKPEQQQELEMPANKPLPRRNAVLVFGAGGRAGRLVVAELLKAGRTVVAAARSAEKTLSVFQELGLVEGRQPSGGGILFIDSNVDVTDPATLTAALFSGVDQVVSLVGRSADVQADGMSSEHVDGGGVGNIAAAAAKYLPKSRRTVQEVLPMRSAQDLAKWQRLDDVIMGGGSSSALRAAEDGSGAVWAGDLIVAGGGFYGARTLPMPVDLSTYDGISLRISGDGQTFKLNIKTDAFSEPEDTYQATFDALPGGDWATVCIPWDQFVPVKRARSVPGGPPLDPSKVRQFGLVYSRFAFNGFPNEAYTPGPFELRLEGGIGAFRAPRPQVVLVSSAGVERNARIGNDEEARKRDIPIVQLNPGGVLNHKYAGEAAVRASGLSYCVVRPTGMSDDGGGSGPALLEASQGDRISGKIARGEVAAVVAAAAGLPAAAMKTIEVRRQAAADAQERTMGPADMLRMFLGAAADLQRTRIGLEPMPAVVPPPPPPSEERTKEILADERVKAVQRRDAPPAGEQGASPAGGAKEASAPLPEVLKVREWIRRWRARTLEKQLPKATAAVAAENE